MQSNMSSQASSSIGNIPEHPLETAKFNKAQNIRAEILKFWSSAQNWHKPLAITLNFKQSIKPDWNFSEAYRSNFGKAPTFETGFISERPLARIDAIEAKGNVRHFLNFLNRSIYKKSAQRYGKHVKVLAVCEGGGRTDKRLHYHLYMETPHIIRQTELRVAIEHCWGKTIWGYRKSKIVGEDLADGQPITFDWVGYMAKLGTKHKNPRTNKTEFTLHKDDYSQSFDWENSRI